MADLFWLNILAVICCIPIITAGASITALHYTCLKLVRGRESTVTKDFFKSFKENFLQSTIIWLIVVLTGAFLVTDFWILYHEPEKRNMLLSAALGIATVLFLCTLVFVFPIQSHFVNTVKQTVKNAFLMSMTVLPKTVLMILLWLVPPVIFVFSVVREVPSLQPISLLFCFSFPAYMSALLYNSTFKKYEPEEKEINDDFSWSVNSDLTPEEIAAIKAANEAGTGENVNELPEENAVEAVEANIAEEGSVSEGSEDNIQD